MRGYLSSSECVGTCYSLGTTSVEKKTAFQNIPREKVCNSLVTHVNSFRGGETIFKPVDPSLYLLTHCCRWNCATHTTVDLNIYHEKIQNTHEEKKDTEWRVVGWLEAQTRVLKRDRDGTGGKKEGERESTQGESSSWYEFMRGWINELLTSQREEGEDGNKRRKVGKDLKKKRKQCNMSQRKQ